MVSFCHGGGYFYLKLLHASILDIYKVFQHIDMLSIGIYCQLYTVIPTLLGLDVGVLGHLCSQNDVIMSWWRPSHLKMLHAFIIHLRHIQSVLAH
jgi:hypothetical protein